MFELILLLTAGVLGTGTVVGYRRAGDVLHPMVFLGPLFIYATVLDPWLVKGYLEQFFDADTDILRVLLLNLFGVSALVLGALHLPRRPVSLVTRKGRPRRELTESERKRLYRVGILLAACALAAYAYGIVNVGGFVEAFSRAKGGGRANSGYINEAMNLGLVAAAMVALSRHRRGWSLQSFALLVAGLLPNLIQGTFGGRRGPLFLCLISATLAWVVTRAKPPKLMVVGVCLAGTLLAVAFIGSQRRFLHLGSEQAEIRWEQFIGALTQDQVSGGNNFIYGAAFIVATDQAGQFTWGRKLLVNLFVRPIPRQLWPDKYEDVGATWATNAYPGLGHLSFHDWIAAVGWLPLPGSSAMSIADLFGEFGWGAILAMYLVGRGFAALLHRRITKGGVWALLYLEALILSIYLATQSFSAFYHRYLILAIPTVIAWRFFMRRRAPALPMRRSLAIPNVVVNYQR